MLDDLTIGEEHAEAVIAAGIEFDAYSEDMPDSKKDKLEAAHEIVGFAASSWVNDEVRDDSDDENVAAAGEQIKVIFSLCGIKAKGSKLTFGKAPSVSALNDILKEAEIDYQIGDDDGDDDDKSDDNEAAFDIEDIIEGYPELTAATKIKKIKALELDPEDDDDYNTLVSIAEWEEAQDEPSSRVLSYLDDVVPPADDDKEADSGDDDDDQEPDETADDAGDADADGEEEPYTEKELLEMDKEELREIWDEWKVEGDFPKRFTDAGRKRVVKAILEAQEEDDSSDDSGSDDDAEGGDEPWEGYNDLSIKDIKEALEAQVDDDDDPLEAAQVEYVIEYEKASDEPRKSLVKWLEELHEQLSGDDDDDEPEEPKTRSRRRSDDDDEVGKQVEDRVKRDDDLEESKARRSKKSAGTITLTRDQILMALAEGEVEIEL